MECRITFEGYTVTGASQLQNVKILMLKGEPGSGGVVDDALSTTSENPVQNAVITVALSNKANVSDIPTKTSDLTNDSGFLTSAPVASVDGKTGAVTVLPTGGSTGQVLTKSSGTNYAVKWATPASAPVSSVNTKTGAVVLGASDVGAIPAPSSASSGQFLVYNGSAWVAQTVPSANGVNF